jgi:peptide/nickel transport system permease protein
MVRFLVRRAIHALPLLFVISVVVFALLHAIPGGPLAVYLSNPNVRPEDIERLSRALGLDRPIWEQYWSWLAAFVRGDWGYSFSDGRPVIARVAERVPATLELVGVAIAWALLLTVPAGVASAASRGGWFDRLFGAAAMAGISLPAFWFGLLLQMLFAIGLGWLPSAGRTTPGGGGFVDHARHLVMPAAVLAIVQAAAWSRYLRGAMIDVLAQPFTMAARARGVPGARVLVVHALRNAIGPVLAVVMLDAALLVSGAVVTESVFAWPGLGSLFTEALARRDYTVLMALLMLSASAIVVLNLIADVAHAALDPRVALN